MNTVVYYEPQILFPMNTCFPPTPPTHYFATTCAFNNALYLLLAATTTIKERERVYFKCAQMKEGLWVVQCLINYSITVILFSFFSFFLLSHLGGAETTSLVLGRAMRVTHNILLYKKHLQYF